MHQLQASQDNEKLVMLVNSGCSALWLVLFVLRCHDFLLNDMLSWHEINVVEVKLTKPKPTSDAQECAGRLEHTHYPSPGQRLKPPANQGIAENE